MFRRAGLIAACAALLAGCESYGDLTSDAFDPGNATASRFALDAAQCAAKAQYPRDYQLPGITEPDSVRHDIFNRAYTECMAALGYPRRDWSYRIPTPYALDLRP
jgi:hypothetical protein